jgi:predicted methyltransferase MtxX (methanogen marker protein 4)
MGSRKVAQTLSSRAPLDVPRASLAREDATGMLKRLEDMAREADVTVGIGSSAPGDVADATGRTAEATGLGRVVVYREPQDLVDALVDGTVDAAVRGTHPAHDVLPALLRSTGAPSAKRAALLVLEGARAVMLTPVGIDEGQGMEDRWDLLLGSSVLLSSIGIAPRVRVMSKGRPEDTDRGEAIARAQAECDALRSRALAEGIEAECVGILVERAMSSGNVVIAPDGVSGNLIFRSLHYVAGMQSWGAIALGLLPRVFVDTSRDKADLSGAVRLARALARVRRT